jgi:hypothetical protein
METPSTIPRLPAETFRLDISGIAQMSMRTVWSRTVGIKLSCTSPRPASGVTFGGSSVALRPSWLLRRAVQPSHTIRRWRGVLALFSAGSAAIVTALRPRDISAQHLKSASGFNKLQNEARNLWEFDLTDLDANESRKEVGRLSRQWSEIVEGSPRVPRRLFRVTDIRYGRKRMYYFPKPPEADDGAGTS